MTWSYLVSSVTVIDMFGPALHAWEKQNVGRVWFDVDHHGHLVLERLDTATGIVKLNPVWLETHGYGRHVEDDGATIRVGDHVFERVRHLIEPFAVYRLVTDSAV